MTWSRRVSPRVTLGALVFGLLVAPLGCGSSAPVRSPASADEPAVDLPPVLTCSGTLPPGEAIKPEQSADTPPVAGRMSETAAEAARAYELELWEPAIPLLRVVAAGRSGDDRGNRQLAQFRLGVALLRTGRTQEGLALLGVIARDSGHAARTSMLAWLSENAVKDPGLTRLLGGFDDTDVEKLKGKQAGLHSRLSYLLGRERYERGIYAEAMFFFSQVDRGSTFARATEDCVARIDAKTQAAASANR